MFRSEAYTLQDHTTIDGQILPSGELVVKAQYLCSIHLNTNWYLVQHTQQHVIKVPTRTILQPRLGFNPKTDLHDIPKVVCYTTEANKYISQHPICLNDSEYDCILK